MRSSQSRRVGVTAEPEDRDVGEGVRDLFRVDPRDVADHEVGEVGAVRRDKVMTREERIELPAHEEVDARHEDGRHDRGE